MKTAAYKNLGPFIATLEGSLNLNEKLLDFYLKMNDPDVKDLGIDKEVYKFMYIIDPTSLLLQLPSSSQHIRSK